jgi:hypothetical protein
METRLAMAGKVLGMATALGGSKLASIEIVNHVLSSISPARVSQWAVLSSPGASPDHYRFGDFIYGNIGTRANGMRSETDDKATPCSAMFWPPALIAVRAFATGYGRSNYASIDLDFMSPNPQKFMLVKSIDYAIAPPS